MSSSIDFFDCPRCGGSAQREQDNRSGEVYFHCSNCGWSGENVDLEEDWEEADFIDEDE